MDYSNPNPPKAPWRWRQGDGQYVLPSDMDTDHVFQTLKMLWNNYMPFGTEVGNVRLYNFYPTEVYTEEYMKQAVYELAWELYRRPDIKTWQLQLLERMAQILDGHTITKS